MHGGSGTRFNSPGHRALVASSRDGCLGVHKTLVSFCDHPGSLGNSQVSPRNHSANPAARSSRQPCTSGTELPASPRRRGGLWERLPWIRAWQRLGVRLWPAEAQASRLPRAHSWSARSPRREVGEGPGPRGRPPCCPATCRVRERPVGSRGQAGWRRPSPAVANAFPLPALCE